MTKSLERYTVITGASSGIGYETAKAFAARGKNLILVARRKSNLENLKQEILAAHPAVKVAVRAADLSQMQAAYQLYMDLAEYYLETWINNAGFGNYANVADQDLRKINAMLDLNIKALTIFSSLFVRDYKDEDKTQLINLSSCGGYIIVPTAVTY